MPVSTLPAGTRGFDCDAPVSFADAMAFRAHPRRYRFVARYVGRLAMRPRDLSTAEISSVHRAGLALTIVQHVELESWVPTEIKGGAYGHNAASFAKALGAPQGMTIWCDLEGVKPWTSRDETRKFLLAWYNTVIDAGYEPGLYVGWHPGLNAEELYRRTRFTKYWGSYNVDEVPLVRGFCMKQNAAAADDYPPGIREIYEIDTNTVRADNFGSVPHFWTPDEFDPR